MKKCKIKITTIQPTPHTEYINNCEFNTREEAMIVLLSNVIDDTAELNWSCSEEEGMTQQSKKYFIPDLSSNHDAIIRAWDGKDYTEVITYDIIEV